MCSIDKIELNELDVIEAKKKGLIERSTEKKREGERERLSWVDYQFISHIKYCMVQENLTEFTAITVNKYNSPKSVILEKDINSLIPPHLSVKKYN